MRSLQALVILSEAKNLLRDNRIIDLVLCYDPIDVVTCWTEDLWEPANGLPRLGRSPK